jgi:hypothetical protein
LLARDATTYGPSAGARFLTRDPLESITREPYGYVGNNPTNMVDPSGLCWGPTCVVEAGIDVVKDVGGRAVDVAVAIRNAPVTLPTAAINSWTGGDCDWNAHLTVVCYGGAVSQANPFADTWTTGSTINTELSKAEFAAANCGGLLEHETWHTRQWALFGPASFTTGYLLNSAGSWLASGDPAKYNAFEWQAGFADGGYADCTPAPQC